MHMASGAETDAVLQIENGPVDRAPPPAAAAPTSRWNLARLPPNLLVHVLRFLGVLEIIVVRQTCKVLHRATCHRSVWSNALRRVTTENGLLQSTFQLDAMSPANLESAATSPYRFLSLLRTKHAAAREGPRGGKPKPLSAAGGTCTLSGGPGAWQNDGAGIFLIPGGRYLLTFGSARISLWDLGFPMGGEEGWEVPEKPLASVHYIYYNRPQFLVRPTPDGRGIRVGVHRDGGYEVAVYEVYPGPASPDFRRVAVYVISGDESVKLEDLSGDRAAFSVGNTLYVWDFMRDLSACWNIGGSLPSKVVLSGDSVLLFREGTLAWWAAVALYPRSDIRPTTAPKHENGYRILELEDADHPGLHGSLSRWYTGMVQSLIFDFSDFSFRPELEYKDENEDEDEAEEKGGAEKEKEESSNNLRTFFSLCYTEGKEPLLIPRQPFPSEHDIYGSSYRICGPSLMQTTDDDGAIKARIVGSLQPLYEDPVSSSVHVSLCKAPRVKDGQASLCPVSGRLCLIKSQSTVRIMDYLAEGPEKSAF